MPEVGIEPTRTQGPEDFESSASTNFTTPALVIYYNKRTTLSTDKNHYAIKRSYFLYA